MAVAFAPDGRLLATAGADGTVRLWAIPGGDRPIRELTGHTAGTQAVAFSPDGRLLATTDTVGHLRLWDSDTDGG